MASHSPQLIITDVRMEKVGGFDVLKEAKEVLPGTPGDNRFGPSPKAGDPLARTVVA